MEKIKTCASHALTYAFAAGMGILSFGGLIDLIPSLVLGVVTLVFTAAIVGSVYRSSILRGFSRFFTPGYTVREQIRERLIRFYDNLKEENKQAFLDQNKWLEEYLNNYARYCELRGQHALNDAQKIEKRDMKRQCDATERNLYRYLKYKHKAEGDVRNNVFTPELCNEIRDAIFCQRTIISTLAFCVSAFAGISLFLTIVGIALGPQGAITDIGLLLTLSIPTNAAKILGCGIAAFAAIPFTYAIYHTITNMLDPYKIAAWARQLRQYKNNRDISKIKRVCVVIGIFLTVALTITASTLTAMSWWSAALDGAGTLIPHAIAAARVITYITMPCYVLAFFSFSITHSVNSVTRFVKKVKNPFPILSRKFRRYLQENGWGQVLNPFTLIMFCVAIPLKMVIFLCHNISEALVNVKIGGGQGVATTVFISMDDAATEADEIFKNHHHGDISDKKPLSAMLKNNTLGEFINQHEAHDHGPLDAMIKGILIPTLIVFHIFAAAWDWSVGNWYRNEAQQRSYCDAFKQSWKQFHSYGDHHHHHHHHQSKLNPPRPHTDPAATVYHHSAQPVMSGRERRCGVMITGSDSRSMHPRP